MEVANILEQHLVNLQVTVFALTLFIHHPDEIAYPVKLFLLLLFGEVKLVDILPFDDRQRTAVNTDEVFHLPHIQKIFGYRILP